MDEAESSTNQQAMRLESLELLDQGHQACHPG
jgi:hypothetical protein